jgi:2-oxoisovalerate dehydrogenase E1 component
MIEEQLQNQRSIWGLELFGRYAPLLKQALLIRFTEERLLELFGQGKLYGTVHTCIGQEFIGVAAARSLGEDDTVFSNHRCHGHFLARTGNVEGLLAEIMGKSSGVCAGLGGSQHLYQDGFYSNGIQGGIVPVGAGLAWAKKLRQSRGISVVFIGDGTLGEGVVYETMNIAAKWKLPLLVVLENNLYAQSTRQGQTLAGDIAKRFGSFGIHTRASDSWNWPRLLADMQESVEMVRSSGLPIFHQVDTYRLMAHSKGDDHRDAEEVADYRRRDPLAVILEQYKNEPALQDMIREIKHRLDRAVEQAERARVAEWPHAAPPLPDVTDWRRCSFERQRVSQGIRQAMEEGLGEDIEDPYGGAFKVTAGLSEKFPERVKNTPISEAAIAGIGNGLALAGQIAVVEIMFGDFMTLIMDQWLNHAAKFAGMYNEQVRVPLLVRTPMGGKRGYGPTHSQSLEKHFLGVPGTQVLCLHHRYSPYLLYRDLLTSIDKPTLVIENKILYGQYADSAAPAGYQLLFTHERFPVAWLRAGAKADVTIVALGGMSLEAEAAVEILFREHEIVADLFFPSQLYPLEVGFLAESLSVTGQLLVVEEGQGFVSLSSEIVAQTAERFAGVLCARLAGWPVVIPSSRQLEERALPGRHHIVNTVLEMTRES